MVSRNFIFQWLGWIACPKVPMQENISDPYNDEVGEHLAKKPPAPCLYIYMFGTTHVLRKLEFDSWSLLHNLHHMHAMLRYLI